MKLLYNCPGVWFYAPVMCRSLMMSYKTQEKYNDIPANRFELDLGNFSTFLHISKNVFSIFRDFLQVTTLTANHVSVETKIIVLQKAQLTSLNVMGYRRLYHCRIFI